MDAVFFGTPDFAADILQALIDSPHNVRACVSAPDRPRDRGKKVQPTPVRALAESRGIPVLGPEKARDKDFISELSQIPADIFIVAAYGLFLPGKILGMPRYGCINVHASLLPKYRGASPITQAIINGDAITGVTIMQMDKGMDTGDILYVKELEISPEDTTASLSNRLSGLGGAALLEALDMIEAGAIQPVPQDSSIATHAPLLTKEMGDIDFKKPAREIVNLVRALDPWPGARTEINGTLLKVWKAEATSGSGAAGSLLPAKDAIIIACGDGAVKLTEIQALGGRRMSAGEYLKGHSL
ncbi:MAG: methionyl-tRNA formyltransferase [Clostridiales bacterium]|jgi:methionyl-tRNA formyltransferase|nr:methionyl-tRNA formyltransferase [Clostridiales bacterium]